MGLLPMVAVRRNNRWYSIDINKSAAIFALEVDIDRTEKMLAEYRQPRAGDVLSVVKDDVGYFRAMLFTLRSLMLNDN
jgi:hypothetical protein